MQLPADFFRNLALSPDVRSNRIHRPVDLQVLEGQAIQPHEVVDMDPGEPLPAITERTAGEDAEGEREQSKSQGAATEDERGANQHDAQTERLGFKGGSLPLLADPSQEGVAGPALLSDELVAAVAVVIDPRGVDEHGETPVGWRAFDGLHDGRGCGEATGQNLRHPSSRPSTLPDAGARQVDNPLRPSQFAHPIAFRGTRIPPDEANTRLRRSAFRTSAQSDDLVPVGRQAGRQPPPNVARSTGDQDFHPYYYARPGGANLAIGRWRALKAGLTRLPGGRWVHGW